MGLSCGIYPLRRKPQKQIGADQFAAYSLRQMSETPDPPLKCAWTTGACATAATKAALHALWGEAEQAVSITLPRGETLPECLQLGNVPSVIDWVRAQQI